jgi:glycosyltransferase A (GT-A) superfamily protein (DUF2064 family)
MPIDPQHDIVAGSSCLVLCLKAPERSKSRLVARLGDAAAVAAAHLLACAFEDLAAWPGAVVLAAAERIDADWLGATMNTPYDVIVQRGDSLGERINYVDGTLRGRGQERIIYIGTDCPALDLAYLGQAAAALNDHDSVLGPARDGGVVLMGTRRPWPSLGDLAWSTASLHAELLLRLREQPMTLTELPELADVDDVKDLELAAQQLVADRRPARKALLGWLQQLQTQRAEAT